MSVGTNSPGVGGAEHAVGELDGELLVAGELVDDVLGDRLVDRGQHRDGRHAAVRGDPDDRVAGRVGDEGAAALDGDRVGIGVDDPAVGLLQEVRQLGAALSLSEPGRKP
jgi:hypothetical protein